MTFSLFSSMVQTASALSEIVAKLGSYETAVRARLTLTKKKLSQM